MQGGRAGIGMYSYILYIYIYICMCTSLSLSRGGGGGGRNCKRMAYRTLFHVQSACLISSPTSFAGGGGAGHVVDVGTMLSRPGPPGVLSGGVQNLEVQLQVQAELPVLGARPCLYCPNLDIDSVGVGCLQRQYPQALK